MESDNRGIRLLKRGKRGLFRLLFSRIGIVTVLIWIEIFMMIATVVWFNDYYPGFYGITMLFTFGMVIYLLNTNMNPTAKITWLILIMLFPFLGAAFLAWTKSNIGHRALKKRMEHVIKETDSFINQEERVLESLKENSPETIPLANYINRSGCYPSYDNTSVKYFSSGEAKFEELLKQLEAAKHFIFMEYFILDEGLMWGKVLEILSKKVDEGVEVRVMYDGTCEYTTLPTDYTQRLAKLGIKSKVFAPAKPFVSTHYNYRDHRKIVVIDGHTAFTGGINLADEYINEKYRFGYWKDTAIMLKGNAVRSFTLMFLQMWSLDDKNNNFDEFKKYLDYNTFSKETKGFVIPYGDCPLDDDKLGERVYMDILNRAHKYVHIMSPYLILDGEMETAIKFAAERGVEVSLILPGVPDKKNPYALAKTHYKSLLESGVNIYEYTPGFVHAKAFVSDDKSAVVGTINLDYRSLYHHFECAAYLSGVDCIEDIERDFQKTVSLCEKVTLESIKKEKLFVKIQGILLKVIAPLL